MLFFRHETQEKIIYPHYRFVERIIVIPVLYRINVYGPTRRKRHRH